MTDKERLDDCRKYLALSVAKECKCETNASVNHDTIDRNLELRKQLEKAEEVIRFYADKDSVGYNTSEAKNYFKEKGE